ncbi:MAG: hypothetical protein KF814_12250 [Nitrospiraceae bacterium]|nr:hypothetical protein [Nitrospiraceae bacterium]
MMGLPLLALILGMTMLGVIHSSGPAKAADSTTSTTEAGLQIEITKIGLGKEVVITRGNKEWFMRVEVTPENSVVVRQEKDGPRYLVDESETHDRSMSPSEIDAAITDFVNSVKTRQQSK